MTSILFSAKRLRTIAVAVMIAVVLAACGAAESDEPTELESAAESTPVELAPTEPAAAEQTPGPTATVEMIPVEPDGGIGDGAGPIPGLEDADDAAADNMWHGAVVAETNCPGTSFQRVDASVFSFSVPVDFVDQEAQPFDSEIGYWQDPAGSIEVSFDYGWYSGPLSNYSGAEVTPIDFSGFVGEHVVIRNSTDWPKPNVVGVHFGQVVFDDPQQWNALNLVVQHDDAADEIIGRCIVDSIEWKIAPGE